MFPGQVTKTSEDTIVAAATIFPKADVIRVTGATAIATIDASKYGGGSGRAGGILFLIPTTGDVGLLDSGNIAVAVTMPQNHATALLYHRNLGKWYPIVSAAV